MGSSLTLSIAKTEIETVVKEYASEDFELIVAKRATHTRLEKKITFGVTVKKEDAKEEELFNKLQSLCFKYPDFDGIASQAYLENRTLKEDYLITVIVKVTG